MDAELASYFRAEAAELLDELTRGLLDLERDAESPELVARCFRLAHTLKGAASAARQLRIRELAHAVEDALAPRRAGGEPIAADLVSDCLQVIEAMRHELELLERAGAERAVPEEPLVDPETGAVRVAVAELSAVLEALAEARSQIGALRGALDAVEEARALAKRLSDPALPAAEALRAALARAGRALDVGLDRIAQELEGAHARVGALRLVPVSVVVGPLELAARDAALALGKQAELALAGAEVRLEGQILAAARDALLHVVRNAVDHGIEPPAERRAAGKPETGRIQLRVERRGHRVTVLCSDDGRGIDAEVVCRAAIERGVLSPEEAAALDRDEALRLVFLPGLSTSAAVSAVSGRGVGLDVAREVAARFHGEVGVTSEAGRGTTIRLELPVSLASVATLLVEHEGSALLPLDAVCGVLRLRAEDIARAPAGLVVVYEGAPVPFAPLADLLHARPSAPRSRWTAVVLRAGASCFAVGVERLGGAAELVVKPLPASAGRARAVVGAALDACGEPLLLLDPAVLAELVRATPPPDLGGPCARRRLPVLVVDDSLTTRMLERSILETAGYEVDLAASAEEGLQKAAARRYGLFVVDVEMAGMSGLEFTARSRSDPSLREVPVMLVTSLASAEDRRRGALAGAAAYMAKSEFDQRRFIRQVAELMEGA